NPELALNNGANALYSGGSGTDTLTFTYTVAAGQDTPDLQVTGLNLNGGIIADAAGNPLSGAVQQDLNLQIDTTAPATPAAPADSAVVNGYVNAANDTAAQGLTGTAEKRRHGDDL